MNTLALTLWQPWADLVAFNGKDTENRPWPTRYRGLILIHAGQQTDPMAAAQAHRHGFNLPDHRGAIIAAAQLTDCHPDAGCCRPWGEPDAWHWRLDTIRPLPAPVRCQGRQRLWTPPEDVLHAVLNQTSQDTAA